MKRPLLASAIAGMVLSLLAGCQNMTATQRNTTAGVVTGAVVGAGVAHATGGKPATGAVVGAAVGGTTAYLWSKNMERQQQELQAASAGTSITVARTADNRIRVHIPADASFQSNSAHLQPRMRRFLNRLAESVRRNPGAELLIVGHADSSGNARHNETLSLQRANATRSYLFSRRIAGTRIQTLGRGAYEPIASNSTAAGRARNRRVEIFVARPR